LLPPDDYRDAQRRVDLRSAFGLRPAGTSERGLPAYEVTFGQRFEVVRAVVPVEAMPVIEHAAVLVHRIAGQPPHPDPGVRWGAVLEALAADFLAGH
jgi:hypothetical protein